MCFAPPRRGSNTLNFEKVNTNMFVGAVLLNFIWQAIHPLPDRRTPLEEGAQHFIILELLKGCLLDYSDHLP